MILQFAATFAALSVSQAGPNKTFVQDIAIRLPSGPMADRAVTAIASADSHLWTAGEGGVQQWTADDQPRVVATVLTEKARWVCALGNGTAIAATEAGFTVLTPGQEPKLIEWIPGPAISVVDTPNGAWLITAKFAYLWQGQIKAKFEPPKDSLWAFGFQDKDGAILGARVATSGFSSGERGVGTSYVYRLIRAGDKTYTDLAKQKDVRGRRWNDEMRGGCSDKSGHWWIATQEGIALSDGKGWWQAITGKDGLPFEDVTCVESAANGDLWVGTTEGACRLRDGKWAYFWGKRWLPGNRVSSIAVDRQGRAWIGTDQGIGIIESRQVTFEQKAAHYEGITNSRHHRNGYVTVSRLAEPESFGGNQIEASDNDGIWSGMYGAAQAFRWAVTKDPEAKRLSQRTLRAMLDLERLSGISGFPARAVIKDGEKDVFESTGEWHRSPVDPTYRWKGDTSSDELDGHFFFYPIYFDLVADSQEKDLIKGVIRRMTDHLLKNGYRLIDLDGQPTRWAVYGPKQLNDDPFWEEQRCLNSLSILKILRVAHHITGEMRYLTAYEDLIQNHHYLINAINQKQVPPVEVNHSDDQLAFFSYYPLLQYETDPNRLRLLKASLERSWQIERPEGNPLFNFIYGAVTDRPCDAEEATQTLQEFPWDLRHWNVKNSHRTDVQFSALSRFDRPELTRVLPARERRAYQWSDNPYVPDGGDGGRREYDGSAWLLAYWLGRHHGLIQ